MWTFRNRGAVELKFYEIDFILQNHQEEVKEVADDKIRQDNDEDEET